MGGKGAYTIGDEVSGTFEFTRTENGPTFDAWYSDAPDRKFLLTPQMGGDDLDEIVGLDMTFAEVPQFVAFFGNEEMVAESALMPQMTQNSDLPRALDSVCNFLESEKAEAVAAELSRKQKFMKFHNLKNKHTAHGTFKKRQPVAERASWPILRSGKITMPSWPEGVPLWPSLQTVKEETERQTLLLTPKDVRQAVTERSSAPVSAQSLKKALVQKDTYSCLLQEAETQG